MDLEKLLEKLKEEVLQTGTSFASDAIKHDKDKKKKGKKEKEPKKEKFGTTLQSAPPGAIST